MNQISGGSIINLCEPLRRKLLISRFMVLEVSLIYVQVDTTGLANARYSPVSVASLVSRLDLDYTPDGTNLCQACSVQILTYYILKISLEAVSATCQ